MGSGRYAPSPTSDLHLGNLRTALLAWLFARQAGMDFYLRIEDLDQARVHAAQIGQITCAQRQLDDLAWLGLRWNEPIWYQSERIDIYRSYASQLETYECFCTRKEIAQAAGAPHGDLRPYSGRCAHLSEKERAELRRTRRPSIRVRAHQAEVIIQDFHAGSYRGVVDDFVLFRQDGIPSYHLASTVDDGLCGVQQVCRGDDLLSSSPRQAWLATQLGFHVPDYVHVSLVYNSQGIRLAKRDHALTVASLRKQGMRSGEMIALLASSAGLPEADSLDELWEKIRSYPWYDSEQIWQPWVIDEKIWRPQLRTP